MALDADEIIKLLYEQEIERRSKTYDRLAIPIAVLAFLGGIFGFYGTQLLETADPQPAGLLILFFLFAVPAALSFVTAIVWLRRSIRRHPIDSQIPPEASFLRERAEIIAEGGEGEVFRKEARRFFSDLQTLLKYANDDRERWLRRAYQALFVATVFALLALIPFLIILS